MSRRRFRSPAWPALFAALAVGAILFLEYGRVPADTLWWTTAYDAGHALVFGVFAISVLGLLRRYLGEDDRGRRRAYLSAFVLAAVAGLATELAQVGIDRDADPWDLMRDVVGAAAFLLFTATLDGDLVRWPARPWIPVKAIVRVAATALLLLAFVPLAVVGLGYVFRDAAFPHLLDFESYWEGRFVHVRDARVTLAFLPEPWTDPNRVVGLVRFDAARWPGVQLREPYPDWTGHETLTFRVWSELDRELPLAIRIDDGRSLASGAYAHRFTKRIPISPGENRIELPLSEVSAARSGGFDLADVRRLMLFLNGPDRPVELYVDDLRLE